MQRMKMKSPRKRKKPRNDLHHKLELSPVGAAFFIIFLFQNVCLYLYQALFYEAEH